jgi:hypothetical protein
MRWGSAGYCLQARILEERLRAALPDVAVEALNEALAGREPFGCVVTAPNAFRGAIAILFYHRLRAGLCSAADFREVLCSAWDHAHRYVKEAAGNRRRLQAMFLAACCPLPEGLPEQVQIWRGTGAQTMAEARRGISWTLSRPVACWFAMRFEERHDKPLVLAATVPRSALLYVSNKRQEQEVLCFDTQDAVIDGTPQDWADASGQAVALGPGDGAGDEDAAPGRRARRSRCWPADSKSLPSASTRTPSGPTHGRRAI